MRVFLTGATGSIGSVVAEQLLVDGHQVVGLARSEESAAKLRQAGIEVHVGDLTDPASVSEAVNSADAIVHTAVGASISGSDEAVQATVQIMIDGLAGSNKPLILTSGLGVYGMTQSTGIDEDTPLPTPPSMIGRHELETQVLASVERGVRAIVLRPAFVYGRAGHRLIQKQIQQARESGAAAYVGAGANMLVFIHTEDLAAAYVQALRLAPAGTLINMVGSHVSSRDFAIGVSYAAGCEGRITSIAPESASATLGSGMYLMGMDMQVSGARAAQVLQWTPRAPSVLYELMYGSYRQNAV